jgi:hypothetical protein
MVRDMLRSVEDYLIGAQALRDLSGRLAEQTRAILQSGDERAIELLNQLEADLIDISEGVLTEEAFREQWQARTRFNHVIESLNSTDRVSASANAVTHRLNERYNVHSDRAA